MLTLVANLRSAARDYLAYRATMTALRRQSPRTLDDAGIDAATIAEAARTAVYGPKPYATPAYRADGFRFLTNPVRA